MSARESETTEENKIETKSKKTHRIEVGQYLLEGHRRRHPEVGKGAREGRQRREAGGAVEDEGEL